jgi:hypothetical protein
MNEISKAEINDFARRLNNVNKNLLKAVYEAESLVRDPIYSECFNADKTDDNFKKLAIAYKKFSKETEDFVSVEFYGETFNRLNELADKLIGE